MNPLVFWVLGLLCIAVEIWCAVTGIKDGVSVAAIAGFGVIGVDRLLLRADRCEEFAEAGEER
ncbi:hypothetical protein [Streptomyces vietnamensis]|uniref:Uncharacterized protein n=1 Tax=Streptomyces vietnamensis TaxID=362257 RepID=A0A0B5I3B7_9ACTN|nr:hypothetical protein [Streptomyces vietnamensis]AJF64962.1 hypothetical protein SVTN_11510 [Streptomyces vietnamensis]